MTRELYIDDGKPHPLSDDFAYILNFISEEKFKNPEEISILQRKFTKEYCHYLLLNDPEQAIEALISIFMPNMYGATGENINFILRPPSFDILHQKGSLALKFKRVPNDNLEKDET